MGLAGRFRPTARRPPACWTRADINLLIGLLFGPGVAFAPPGGLIAPGAGSRYEVCGRVCSGDRRPACGLACAGRPG